MRYAKAFVAAVLAACASSGAQKVYVAPSNDTITSTTEEGMGGSPVHNIYVVNGSTEPIIVFGVTLRECENIKQPCEPKKTDIRIEGGRRSVVLRVEPKNLQQAFSYRFSYSWRPEKAAALPTLP